jgi:beta-phosphoglucomutase-like phosphatase (HAD superfamily)
MGGKQMFKAVIFDMDGTIVDSEPIYEEVNDEIYEKYGFDLNQKDYDRHMGANMKDIWTDILEHHPVKEEFSHYKI